MSTQTNQTAAEVFAAVLNTEGFRCPRTRLERRLAHVSPLTLNDAIELLLADGALTADGDDLQAPLADGERPTVERLAASVNAILVISDPPVLTFEQVCAEVERDPATPQEHREVLLALTLLDYCQLAKQDNDSRWRPTRAALWAERLSF